MGPPWLLYSDEKLLQTFEHDALYGKADVIRWNQILYERFYLGRGDFTKAKRFIDTAADLGDEAAKEILKDPNLYYREFKTRCGEKVPNDFQLK